MDIYGHVYTAGEKTVKRRIFIMFFKISSKMLEIIMLFVIFGDIRFPYS